MKRLVLIIAALLLVCQNPLHRAKAAPLTPTEESTLPTDPATGKVAYKGIVDASGATKAALFQRAKKWVASKSTTVNPYTVTMESESEGTLMARGNFMLPAQRKKYNVQFRLSVSTKAGKFKYEFTDLLVQLVTQEAAWGVAIKGFAKQGRDKEETMEYSLESFYPSRITSKEPVVKNFDEINAASFAAINREMTALAGSLKQALTAGENDW